MLVLLVPVFFGLMGFAIDLGRLYMVRNELKAAANAMALSAAAQLNGTEVATANAETVGTNVIRVSNGVAAKYDFGGNLIGQSNGNLNSEAPVFDYYDNRALAITPNGGPGGVGATVAKYVKVTMRAEAPTIFWRFLSLAQEGKVNLVTEAVAGVSAPVCQACGIEPIAIAPISTEDPLHYGFTVGTKYTFGYFCNGGPQPAALTGTGQRIPYLIINRLDEGAQLFPDELTQLYRAGAQGLPASANQNLSCVRVSAEETIWVNAAPLNCNAARVANQVTTVLCGLGARFDQNVPAECNLVPEAATVATANVVDTDLADTEDYTTYTGNNRRIITVPVVETISAGGTMLVLGFRQFLLMPSPGDTTVSAGDTNGRFVAMYIGNPMPLRSGRLEGCTGLASGPGKVVLHR